MKEVDRAVPTDIELFGAAWLVEVRADSSQQLWLTVAVEARTIGEKVKRWVGSRTVRRATMKGKV